MFSLFMPAFFWFRKRALKIPPKISDFLPQQSSYVPRFLDNRLHLHFSSHNPTAISDRAKTTSVILTERKQRQSTAKANAAKASFLLMSQHLPRFIFITLSVYLSYYIRKWKFCYCEWYRWSTIFKLSTKILQSF